MKQLVYGDVFRDAWKGIKDDLPLVAAMSAVFMFGSWVISLIPYVGNLFVAPLSAGFLKCLLQIRRRETFTYSDFFWGFQDFNRFLHLVLLNLILSLGIGLGLLLLIVPGIWFMTSVLFSTSLFVQGKHDAVEVVKQSMDLVKGRWWNIFGLLMCIFLLNMAGAMCLLIGLLISCPLSVLAIYVALEQLQTAPVLASSSPDPSPVVTPAESTSQST